MSRARNLGNLGNENLISGDTANLRVGINSTLPTTKLDVDGNVTATAFFGDGSNLEGVASAGLGTALSDDGTGSVIYYTNTVLGIGSTMVVDPPSTTRVAYTQYADISVDENVDLIVVEGDDFVPDILGLSTEGATELTGVGGRIRAGSFTNKAGTGAPKLTFGAEVPVGVAVTGAGGINVAGFATAGGFVGNLTGNCSGSSGSATGNAGGLTGTPDITVRNITGVAATFTGVLTYEDVTNVDSVGVITARGGIEIGASGVGGTISPGGNVKFTGITTVGAGLSFADDIRAKFGAGGDLELYHNGTDSYIDNNQGDLYVQTTGSGDDVFVQPSDALYLQSGGANTRLLINGVGSFTFDNGTFIEKCKITAGKLSDNTDIDLLDGMVHYFSTQETTTSTPNLRESASRTLGDAVNTGDIVTVNIITTAAAGGYSANLQIDGQNVTEEWVGGAAPSAGGSDGLDIYVYTCIRIGSGTGDSGWKVIANVTNATN